jgi:hypothetical protein
MGKVGTCHDLPPKVEGFDAALAANEVLALEDSIKRYPASYPLMSTAARERSLYFYISTRSRWQSTFKIANGRAPSAGDMINDVQVAAILEKRRRLQGKALVSKLHSTN